MRLADWLGDHPAIACIRLEDGAMQLFTTDPTIWQVTDYHITSAVSGPAVIIVPRVCICGHDAREHCYGDGCSMTVERSIFVGDHGLPVCPCNEFLAADGGR